MSCLSPVYIPQFDDQHRKLGYLSVRCGKCQNCRKFYARMWSFRCVLESKQFRNSWFLTFTYDDEYLNKNIFFVGNESFSVPTLVKRDYQLLFKNVRSAGVRFRYFIAGEYGSRFGRPHFHAIVFGPDSSEILFFKKFWKKGFVDIGYCSDESSFYTAGYVQKKLYGDDKKKESVFRLPEFSQASIAPPLGFNTFLSLYNNGKVKDENGFLSICYKGFSYPVPRIFKQKLGISVPNYLLTYKRECDMINEDKRLNKLGLSLKDVELFNFRFKGDFRNESKAF